MDDVNSWEEGPFENGQIERQESDDDSTFSSSNSSASSSDFSVIDSRIAQQYHSQDVLNTTSMKQFSTSVIKHFFGKQGKITALQVIVPQFRIVQRSRRRRPPESWGDRFSDWANQVLGIEDAFWGADRHAEYLVIVEVRHVMLSHVQIL
jgi:hypothetical protein